MKEIWKPLYGFENTHTISNLGKVKSKRKTLKPLIHKQGYLRVDLWDGSKKIRKYIHRLVAQTFLPNPDNKPCVCHKDDDPSNPSLDNLFWGTHMDNMRDMYSKGRRPNPPSRSVLCIDTGEVFESSKHASERYGVSLSTIRQSCLTNWKACGYDWEFIN